MAVDRGGLRFGVGVDYDPTNAQRFRTDVEAMRQSFAALKAEFQSGASAAATIKSNFGQLASANAKVAQATNQNAKAQKALAQAELAQSKASAASALAATRKEKASQAAADALRAEQRLENELLKTERERANSARASAQASAAKEKANVAAAQAMQAEIKIERELAAVEKARADLLLTNARIAARASTSEAQAQRDAVALARAKANLASAEERARSARISTDTRAAAAAERLRRSTKGANDELARTGKTVERSNSSLSQFLFTFRRLIGVLALFQAARKVFAAFVDLIRSGLNFNKTIETARLSVTGLILSLTDVVDAQGRVVEGAQAIAAAQAEAARQTELLRKDSLATTASFEELLTTFQTAVGPGITAGLKLDEIRKLAVRVAQVAPLVGLLQNQLAEEIRSLTTGVIRPQTSRIATVFGITAADIQRAKEAGRLSEFLEERFRGIQVISGKISFTLEGIQTRLKSAFAVTSGEAATGFFEEIKATLTDITDLMADPATLAPRPEVVATLRTLFDALTNIVKIGREAVKSLSFEGASKAIGAIAFLIERFGVALVGALIGGLEAATGLILTIQKIFDSLGLSNEVILAVVRGFTKFFLIAKSVTLVTDTIGKSLIGISKLLPGMLTNAKAIGAAMGGWVTASILVAGGISTVFEELERRRVEADDQLQKAVLERAKTAEFLKKDAAKQSVDRLIGSLPSFMQRAIGATEREFDKFMQKVEIARKLEEKTNFRARGRPATDEEKDEVRRALQSARLSELEFKNQVKRSSLIRVSALDEKVGLEDARATLAVRREELAQLIENNKIELERLELKRRGAEEGAPEEVAILEDKILATKEKQKQEENALVAAIDAANQEEQIMVDLLQEALEAREEELRLARQAADQAITQAGIEEDIVRLKRLRTPPAEIALRAAEAELSTLEKQRDVLRENNQIALERGQRRVDTEVSGSEGQKRALEDLVALTQQQAAAEAELSAEIANATLNLEKQKEIAQGSFFDGINEGLQLFKENIPTVFQQGLAAAAAIIDGFTSLVSSAIVDAFDPTNDTSFKERIGRFFQDIANLLLQQAITNIIAALIPKQIADTQSAAIEIGAAETAAGIKAAAAAQAAAAEIAAASQAAAIRTASSAAGLGFNRGGLVRGFADGGPVGLFGRWSPAHARARGYATGGAGFGRPAGLDPRDTIPAWLAHGEFVQPTHAVAKAGSDFMEILRRGDFDRNMLRAAVGLGAGRGILGRAPPPRRGYAEGGPVTGRAAGDRQQPQQPIPAFLVADDKTAEQLWKGGKTGWLRMFRENGDEISRAIRSSRR